jgi:MFS family permease
MEDKIWNKNFILLVLSNFLMYSTYYSILSVLPLYLVNITHATKIQVGVVVGVFTIASVIVRPFSGYVLDRFGRRTIFILSLILYSFFFIGYLFSNTILSIVVLRFLHGLIWGFVTVSGPTIAVDIIPERKKGEGIGYFALSTTLGMSIGPFIGMFVSYRWGYNFMFISGCLISLIGLYFTCCIKLRKRFLLGRKIQFKWNRLFDSKSIIPSVNVFITMLAYGGLISFITLYGKELGIKNASFYFFIFSVGIAIARLTTGRIFDKKGPRLIVIQSLLLLIIGFGLLAVVKSELFFYLTALIIGFGNGGIYPVFQSIINNLSDPKHRGTANSTLYTAIDLGLGLGMVFAGSIAHHYSISMIFVVNSVICLFSLAYFYFIAMDYYKREMLYR